KLSLLDDAVRMNPAEFPARLERFLFFLRQASIGAERASLPTCQKHRGRQADVETWRPLMGATRYCFLWCQSARNTSLPLDKEVPQSPTQNRRRASAFRQTPDFTGRVALGQFGRRRRT